MIFEGRHFRGQGPFVVGLCAVSLGGPHQHSTDRSSSLSLPSVLAPSGRGVTVRSLALHRWGSPDTPHVVFVVRLLLSGIVLQGCVREHTGVLRQAVFARLSSALHPGPLRRAFPAPLPPWRYHRVHGAVASTGEEDWEQQQHALRVGTCKRTDEDPTPRGSSGPWSRLGPTAPTGLDRRE